MSALTDRIANEHRVIHLSYIDGNETLGCEGCHWRASVPASDADAVRRAHIAEMTEAAIAALLPTALADTVRGAALALQYGFSLEEVAAEWETVGALDTLSRITKEGYS